MSDIKAKATHYMTFPHVTSGLTRGDFTIRLFKNGTLINDIGVDLQEITTGVYVATFANDGEDFSNWTLLIEDPAQTDYQYIETWQVRKPTLEQSVQLIRSQQESLGGFFNRKES